MIIGIIPARKNSKRIKNKNIINCGGKPLIFYTIEAALNAKIDEVYVSTDSQEIADISVQYGAQVISRPSQLSEDDTSSEVVLQHAVNFLELSNKIIQTVVMLQPTSPLRRATHINGALDLFFSTQCDSVIGVNKDISYYFLGDVDEQNKFYPDFDLFNNRKMTQEIPNKFHDNGSIYIMTRELIMNHKCRMGKDLRAFKMDRWSSIDIDNYDDLFICENYLNRDSYNE